ncbi:MAG: GntR family transcriptional regulator [Mycoplasmatales bacterium]
MNKYEKTVENMIVKIKTGLIEKKLPSEKKLADEYQVSINTIRKSLSILIQSGIVISRHGSGYYVSELYKKQTRNSLSLQSLSTCYPDQEIESKIEHFEIKESTTLEAANLNIEVGTIIYKIKRVRYLNKIPTQIENTIIPFELIPNLTYTDLQGSLFKYIEENTGQKIDSASKEIHATTLTQKDATLLNIDISTPVILIINYGFLKNGIQFEYSVNIHTHNGINIIVKS